MKFKKQKQKEKKGAQDLISGLFILWATWDIKRFKQASKRKKKKKKKKKRKKTGRGCCLYDQMCVRR